MQIHQLQNSLINWIMQNTLFNRSIFSAVTAGTVLSDDSAANVGVCDRSVAIATISEITSQIICPHVLPVHQHEQHKEEWAMQNADSAE